jgi:lipopolysaccharide transport system permease protein
LKTIDYGFELQGEKTTLRKLITGVWRSRSLVRMLARRDFYVKYRRPTLGVLWAVVLPLIQAVMLSFVFTRVVRIKVPVAYPVFILTGILPWTYFSSTLSTAVRSITTGSNIASKVYFPRAVLPLVSVGSQLYGFMPTLSVMVIAAFYFGVPQGFALLLLIPATILMVLLTAGFSMLLAAMQVYFRDVAYIVMAVTQAWFYGSAVFYPVELVPKGIMRQLVLINPATGMIELFRVAVIGSRTYSAQSIFWTIAWCFALFFVSALLYRRYDRVFVDRL